MLTCSGTALSLDGYAALLMISNIYSTSISRHHIVLHTRCRHGFLLLGSLCPLVGIFECRISSLVIILCLIFDILWRLGVCLPKAIEARVSVKLEDDIELVFFICAGVALFL